MADPKEIRFLIVDSSMTMRKVISQQLKGLGATQIQEASSGSQAWDVIEKVLQEDRPIQFIISEWNLAELTGLELLKKCRAHDLLKDAAFILVSAEAESQQVNEAVKSGVDSYVVKPFSSASLVAKVKAVLQKRFH